MSGPQPNGTKTPQNNASRAPPVVGINFGNSYASIAVLNKASCSEVYLLVWLMASRTMCLIASQTKMVNVKSQLLCLFMASKWCVASREIFSNVLKNLPVHRQSGEASASQKCEEHYHWLPKSPRSNVCLIDVWLLNATHM